MIHRSMLIMNDQQSFMAMIIDHHVWSTGFHSMINRFHAWSTAFHSMINRYHAWSIAYHSMINKFHTWSTWSMIMNDHCSLISYMINSVHKAMITIPATATPSSYISLTFIITSMGVDLSKWGWTNRYSIFRWLTRMVVDLSKWGWTIKDDTTMTGMYPMLFKQTNSVILK